MEDQQGDARQLVQELDEARRRIAALEASLAERERAEKTLRESERCHRRLAENGAEEIARRKEAEVQLLRIRKAVDSATDAIGITDLDESSPYYFNAALVKLFGYTAEEIRAAGGPAVTYRNPEDARRVFTAIRRGEPWSGEVPMRTRQGQALSVFLRASAIFDESGNIIGLVGIHTDITECKKAEQALRESKERYRLLVETTSDWVWEVDRDAVYTYASPKIKDFLGYEPEEVLGKTPFDFMEPDDARRLAKWFSGKTESPRAFASMENVNRHKDGRRVVLETSGVPLLDDQGRFAGFRGIDRDITSRKLAEETVEKEQQLLRELLSMQERDRKLIAYEIHDGLAQQLTGALLRFQAYSELSDLHGEEAQRTFDAAMALLGDGMAETRRLIDGLRPPILDESGVAAAIEYLVCEVRERCSLDIEYIVDVHFDRLAFPLEGALFRVVQESLTNACRHSKSKSIKVQLLHQGDRVIVEVQDWGIGFDPKDVPDTRFGLQGIQERARLLGGTATVDSAPGQGTRIHVELPLVARV